MARVLANGEGGGALIKIMVLYQHSTTANNGVKLINWPRKTFIQGFAVSSKSILALAKHLLHRSYNPYEYVLTCCFS